MFRFGENRWDQVSDIALLYVLMQDVSTTECSVCTDGAGKSFVEHTRKFFEGVDMNYEQKCTYGRGYVCDF